MKKRFYTILILTLLAFTNAFGQRPAIELTFTATYSNQAVALDSIYIENLTQGGDTTLLAPDNVLVLDYLTGIGDDNVIGTNKFSVSPNFPNPFNGKTTINLYVPQKDMVNISVTDLMGREVASYSNILETGKHSFSFVSGNDKYYLFSASCSSASQSIKMMNFGRGEKQLALVYSGIEGVTGSFKLQTAISSFVYTLGDQLRFIGYAATPVGTGSDVMEDTPQVNETYQFTILEGIPCPGTPNITYEDQTYKTVQVGNQCWFKENLNVGNMVNGSGDQTNNGVIEKYCYGNHPADCETYGGLYQWNEMMEYSTTPGVQGICPDGWHLPTDGEFCTLATFLDPTVDCGLIYYTGTDAAGKMKSTGNIDDGTGLWNAPNAGATNESGFTVLPSGVRWYDATFGYLGVVGGFATSSEKYSTTFWEWGMNCDSPALSRDNYSKNLGNSVRCIKD